jgi:hypothetical protein
MSSDYPLVICWPLYRLSFRSRKSKDGRYNGRKIPKGQSEGINQSRTDDAMGKRYQPFGIFWPLYRLSYFDVCLLITDLVSFGHSIVCPTSMYAFWLPLRYLLAIVTMAKRYQMGNQKAYIEVGQTMQWAKDTKMVIRRHKSKKDRRYNGQKIPTSVLLRFVPSDYPFGICWPLYHLSYFDLCLLIIPSVSFGHCIVCPSSIDAFWLPLW